MSLDLFAPSIAASDQDVVRNAAKNLPAEMPETFDVAWRSGTEFHNSAAYSIARSRALTDYNDFVFGQTGERLPTLNTTGGELQIYGGEDTSLDAFNAAQSKIAEKYPGVNLQPLSDADIDTMTRRRMAKAHDDAAAMQQRETTWGGTLGTGAGMIGASFTDPVVLATLPLGGIGEAGVALRAGEFALISGGTEAAVALASYKTREAAVPGSSKEIPAEIAGATLFGGLLGAGFAGLGKLFKMGEKPLPTSLREDLNAVTSEAQINATNPFPTAAGEAAARDAVTDAATSIVRGEPVRAGDNFDPANVRAYAEAAGVKTSDELAAAAEQHLRPETFGEKPDNQKFDPMPAAADDAASYWDRRIEAATPAERKALGATDDLAAAEKPAAKTALDDSANAPESLLPVARDLSPEELTNLAKDPAVDDATLHNLEHIMAADPEREFTTATRLPDGSYRLDSRKLSDVLKELDETEQAAKEIAACAVGLEAAE